MHNLGNYVSLALQRRTKLIYYHNSSMLSVQYFNIFANIFSNSLSSCRKHIHNIMFSSNNKMSFLGPENFIKNSPKAHHILDFYQFSCVSMYWLFLYMLRFSLHINCVHLLIIQIRKNADSFSFKDALYSFLLRFFGFK